MINEQLNQIIKVTVALRGLGKQTRLQEARGPVLIPLPLPKIKPGRNRNVALHSAQNIPYCALGIANPFSPYSIQKRPEPQICPKFVPTIVFRSSNQGDPKLSKICRKFSLKICPEIVVFQFLKNFWQIWVPLIVTPKNNRRDKFWTNLGFGGVFECCKGKKGSQHWDIMGNLGAAFLFGKC